MSHAVKIEQRFMNIEDLRAAFAACGWSMEENANIRTYHDDPAGNMTFRWVAKNPHLNAAVSYDIGITQEADGRLSFQADWSMGHFQSLATEDQLKTGFQHGRIGNLAIEYNKIQYQKLAARHHGKVVFTPSVNGAVNMELEVEVDA